jgi:exonuclease III
VTHTYTVASLNINGIANHTRIKILEDFFWTQDIDIALLQEVTCLQLDSVRRYTQHINVGTEKRGTAILAKDGIMLTSGAFRQAGA